MDRQGNHETADRPDGKLSKALDVIVDSYNGASADRLYRDAIYCFDSLIEISHNTEDIRDFARRNEMDGKYLVDGANFVISKMHFNSEGNFYVTLGLPKNATQNEIRERWKRLMLLYHPDKQLGEEEWVSERAKKVNEAYSILKDEGKRQSYDLKLIEKTVHKHSDLQPVIRAVPVSNRIHKLKTSDSLEWGRKKKYLPRVLLGLYVLAAMTLFIYIYFQNKSEVLESALTAKPGKAEQIPAPSEKKSTDNTIQAHSLYHAHTGEAAGKQQPITGTNSLPKFAGTSVVSQTINELRETQARRENRKIKGTDEGWTTSNKAGSLPGSASSLLGKSYSARESGSKTSISAFKENPKSGQGANTTMPAQADHMKAYPAKKVHDQDLADLTKEEVEGFIRLYSSVYLKNDISAFMSLFSASAVGNNSLHYNEIRAAYLETFSEKTGYYKINSLTIVINGKTAKASGVYDLNRYISALDRWIRYQGKIQWEIARENNTLKIIRINYD